MKMSATYLGYDYNLSPCEMNCVLCKMGFLQGEPGNYELTQLGLKYATEKNFHRGTGGYDCYNRFWTTRTYDESIKEEIDKHISSELIKEVKDELAQRRALQKAERAIQDSNINIPSSGEIMNCDDKNIKVLKYVGIGVAATAAICLAGYGIYKTVPKVKKWYADKQNNKSKYEVKEYSIDENLFDL